MVVQTDDDNDRRLYIMDRDKANRIQEDIKEAMDRLNSLYTTFVNSDLDSKVFFPFADLRQAMEEELTNISLILENY